MHRFCVSTNPLISGEHEVHRDCCPDAPPPGDRLDLGFFHTGWDAINEAMQRFAAVDGCRRCLPGCHMR